MPQQFAGELGLRGVNRIYSTLQQRSLPPNLQQGQIYKAIVEQVQGGVVLMRIGEFALRTQSDLDVEKGQGLLLRLNSTGDMAEFEIVRVLPMPARRDSAAGAQQSKRELEARIQSLVSRQHSPQGLLSVIRGMGDPAQFAANLAPALAVLAQRMQQPADLSSATRLKKAIKSSGLMLEGNLAAAVDSGQISSEVDQDFKLALLRLSQGLADMTMPGEGLEEQLLYSLREKLEGVLARISLQQISCVAEADEGRFHWALDLPILSEGQLRMLRMRISHEPDQKSNAGVVTEKSWRVEVSTELARLGPIRLSLYLSKQNLSVSLQAQRASTVELLSSQLDELEKSLAEDGFEVSTLVSRPTETHSVNTLDIAGKSGGFQSVITVQA